MKLLWIILTFFVIHTLSSEMLLNHPTVMTQKRQKKRDIWSFFGVPSPSQYILPQIFPTLYNYNTPSVYGYNYQSPYYYNTPSLNNYNYPSLYNYDTPSVYNYNSPSVYHYNTPYFGYPFFGLPYNTQSGSSFTNDGCGMGWENWKIKYNKHYGTQQEDDYRRNICCNSVRRIQEHNARYQAGYASFQLGQNKFCDMTNEEFAPSGTGIGR